MSNSKFKYAPGLPGYGTQGVDGSNGLTGLSFYFSDLDGTGNNININTKIVNNKLLYSNVDDFLPGYPTRIYQHGDLFVDKNSVIYEIIPEGDNGPSGFTYYLATGYLLNISGYFSLTNSLNTGGDYKRVINTVDPVSNVKYLIDNIYPAVPGINYTLYPNTIYKNKPIDFAQIKFVDVELNSRNPFMVFTAGVNNNNSFAISRDLNNTFRIGNLDTNNILRDVSLALDFKNVLWNIPNVTFQVDNSIKINFEIKSEYIPNGIEKTYRYGNAITLDGQKISISASNLGAPIETQGGDITITGGYNYTMTPNQEGNIIRGGNIILKGGHAKALVALSKGSILGGDIYVYGGTYEKQEWISYNNDIAPITFPAPDNNTRKDGVVNLGLNENLTEVGTVKVSKFSYMMYDDSDYKLLSTYDLNPVYLFNNLFNPNASEPYWDWDSSGNEISILWDKKGFFANYTNGAQVQTNLVLYKDNSIYNNKKLIYEAATGRYRFNTDVSAFNPIILHNLEASGTVTISGLEYDQEYNAYLEFVEKSTAASYAQSNGWIRKSKELDMRVAGNAVANVYYNFINNSSINDYLFVGFIYNNATQALVAVNQPIIPNGAIESCDSNYFSIGNVPYAALYDVSIYASKDGLVTFLPSTRQQINYSDLKNTKYLQFAINKEETFVSTKFFSDIALYEDASACKVMNIGLYHREKSYTAPAGFLTYVLTDNKDLSTNAVCVENCTVFKEPDGSIYFDASIYMTVNGLTEIHPTFDYTSLDVSIWATSPDLSPNPIQIYSGILAGSITENGTTTIANISGVSSYLNGIDISKLVVHIGYKKDSLFNVDLNVGESITVNSIITSEVTLRSENNTFDIMYYPYGTFKGKLNITLNTFF
jgi:hypothetical protein